MFLLMVRFFYPYVYGFLNCSGKAFPHPAYNAEVVQCGRVVCGGLVAIYGHKNVLTDSPM